MQLSVVRHGETTFNQEERLTGQLDIPLNDIGRRQAQQVGVYLAERKIAAVISSDLQRTRNTAREIAWHHNLPVQEDPDLREILLGVWEGRTHSDIAMSEPEQVRQWRTNPVLFAPDGGELLPQVEQRVQRALDRWYTQYPDGNVVWATHGGFIGILICHLLKLDLNRRRQFAHSNASLSEFRYSTDEIGILCLNETSYLRTLHVPLAADREL